jgi:hypothetical protein
VPIQGVNVNMEILGTFKAITDKIPTIVETIRNLIVGIASRVNLPPDTHLIIFLLVSLYAGYLFIKQFVAYSIFSKVSTVVNWLLVALLIYVLLAYV